MKKTISIFIFLVFPFFAKAQWSAYARIGAGFAGETINESVLLMPDYNTFKPYLSSSALGYSFQGGLDVNYFFSTRFGLASGLDYNYAKCPGEVLLVAGDFYSNPHSEALKIPLSLLWSPGKRHRSLLRLGLSANFGLMYNAPGITGSILWYNYYFWGVQIGYARRWGDRFRLGLLWQRNLNWYMEEIAGHAGTDVGSGTLFAKHYFSNLMITVSYRLLGGKGKK